ncbi:hypothetical protein N7475_007939 [Penicillium sp. IBT 31633x]|nr:hypothetical protein N7475_007939 [Penicillium sp. IBT 31633x]
MVIYLEDDPAAWEKTCALWTGIVASVSECIGVTGGRMVKPIEGSNPGFVVYNVGCQLYVTTNLGTFADERLSSAKITRDRSREYGHVAFENARAQQRAKL